MNQNDDEYQQCFIPSHLELILPDFHKQSDLSQLNLNNLIEQAKQLHNRPKPQNLAPRTCFLQLPLYKLPQLLSQISNEQQDCLPQNKILKTIENSYHLTFEQYFKNHSIIYNKMKIYNQPAFDFPQITCRFKPISHLSDFHQKLFKQLKSIQSPNKINSHPEEILYDGFDSNFESGNLGIVYKKYFLLLQNDTNTHGYASWFFFKVISCGKGRASFHILNLSKSPYLYRLGWKISIFSIGKYFEQGKQWFKGGNNIQTYPTNFEKLSNDGGSYNCLYFEYDFTQYQSQVYFSMSQPYTYSMLINNIQKIQHNIQSTHIKLNLIKNIYSVACNIIPIMILSYQNENIKIQNIIQIQNIKIDNSKKILLFMARQHPAQVVGSRLMDAFMKIITDQIVMETKYLLTNYTVVVIPMVNPDGVIHGNSRCNLAGLDLNRQWTKQAMREVTPQTFYLRKLIWQLQQKVGIEYLIDFHGHSKKLNSFFFCNKFGDKYHSQHLPFIASKLDKKFQFSCCTFHTSIDKKNTLRNQLFQQGMKNCVTVENSYFGYLQQKQKSIKPYKQQDFSQLSLTLIKSLYFLLSDQQNLQKSHYPLTRYQFFTQLKTNKQLYQKKQSKTPLSLDIQSQSDPQGDIMLPQQMIQIYQCKQLFHRKNNTILFKNKFKTKNFKYVKFVKDKKNLLAPQIKVDDQEDIRKSQNINVMPKKSSQRVHKSQKKLQIFIKARINPPPTKQTIQQYTSSPTYQTNPSQTSYPKKKPQKKQRIIKSSHTTNNKNQMKIATVNSVDSVQAKHRNSIHGNTFTWNINYEDCQTSASKKKIKNSQSQQKKALKKNITFINNFKQLKTQQSNALLHDTLSIIKMYNQQLATNSNQLHHNQPINKKKLVRRKISQNGIALTRAKTQSTTKDEIEFVLQPYLKIDKIHNESIKQQRKKMVSYNYKKQLLKRKKIFNFHNQIKNSKKISQLFHHQHLYSKKSGHKIQVNSVFYYFPVL